MALLPNPVSLLAGFGAKFPASKVLFDDTFDDGFCGWDALMDSSTPRPPVTLTSKHPFTGKHALRLGTGNVGVSSREGYGAAIKRLTRVYDVGVINFELWWGFGSTDWPNAPANIGFNIDSQKRDGSARTFAKHRWQIVNPADGTTGYYTWGLKNNAGTITNTTAVYALPFNENKENLIYTRFRFDLTSGYQDMWIWDAHFDLTGVGAGTGSDSTVTNFNGGLNFMIDINNRSGGSGHTAQSWVTIGRARGWYE